jgi:serine phosphatase RsbU (regulator of sigma subunit)
MADSKTAWLEIGRKDQPPQRLDLTGASARLGRAANCDVRAAGPQISDLHAEIRRDGVGFAVHDLASESGVFVNGARTYRRLLRDGDVVELGRGSPVRITFHAPTVAAAPAPAPAPSFPPSGGPAGPADGRREQSALTHLARFFELSRKLGGAVPLDEVLSGVVDLAIDLTRAERGLLVQLREDQGLELCAARDDGGATLATDGLKISETLVRKAMDGRVPLLVSDVGDDESLSNVASIVSLELRSAVILPLTRFSAEEGGTGSGDVFGALYLDSRRRRAGFASLDLRILERLAHDASAALEHARLLREAQEKRRIEQEVRTAREVQAALMPDEFLSTEAFEIAGLCVPCLELGGDYVDQFDLGRGRTTLVLADVSGKGISASLLAAALQGALAAEIAADRAPDEIVARVNRVHGSLAPPSRFVTMVLAVLEQDGGLRLVTAGHCPPLLVHAGGVTRLSSEGIALGLDEDATYRVQTTSVPRGDFVVMYSDGVIECEGPGQELYGMERLERLLQRCRGEPAKAVLDAVTQDVAAFRRGTAVADDLSVIVLRRL